MSEYEFIDNQENLELVDVPLYTASVQEEVPTQVVIEDTGAAGPPGPQGIQGPIGPKGDPGGFTTSSTYTGDLNALTTAGLYNTASGLTNAPIANSGGHIEVTRLNTYIKQEWHARETGLADQAYTRVSSNTGTTWSAWVKTSTDVVKGTVQPYPLIDDRTARFTPHQSASGKTGAIMIPIVLTGALMFTVEVDIHSYNAGYSHHKVRASAYFGGPNGPLHNQHVRIDTGSHRPDVMGPLAVPKVRWVHTTGVANTVYLLIGDIDSAWAVGQVQVTRTIATYTNDTYVTTGNPNYVTTLPTGTITNAAVTMSTGEIYGAGSPEGVVQAQIGARYTDWNATNGAVSWIKATGNNTSTGWKVVYGDTGWRDLTASVDATKWNNVRGTLNFVYMRRVNDQVQISVRLTRTGSFGTSRGGAVDGYALDIPAEFRSPHYVLHTYLVQGVSIIRTPSSIAAINLHGGTGTWAENDRSEMQATYFTNAAWPTTLPGVAV